MDDLFAGRGDLQEVVSNVFITNFAGAKNRERVFSKNITHVLCCDSMAPLTFEKELLYKRVGFADNTNVRIPFADCFEFIDEARKGGGRILVHCLAGSSRSGAVVVGYTMKEEKISLDDALKKAQEKRPLILPNPGFMEQLLELQKELGIE